MEIDLKPTQEMAANAARGLELREKHGRGAFLQACDNAASGEILWAFRVQTWEI